MDLTDFLSQDEIKDYHLQWANFKGKFTPETPYAVHSSLPVIGKIFQYEDKPVFRAKILKRALRKLDPYFLGKKGYIHSNFHITHYFLPLEQIFHASVPGLVSNYNDYLLTDKFGKEPPLMNSRVHFDNNHPSVGIAVKLKQNKKKFVFRFATTFYEDTDNSILQEWYIDGVAVFRPYANCIHNLREDFTDEIRDELIRKIDAWSIRHERLINPRESLPDKDDLIEKLNSGLLPERELHDFFSLWEPDKKDLDIRSS